VDLLLAIFVVVSSVISGIGGVVFADHFSIEGSHLTFDL